MLIFSVPCPGHDNVTALDDGGDIGLGKKWQGLPTRIRSNDAKVAANTRVTFSTINTNGARGRDDAG